MASTWRSRCLAWIHTVSTSSGTLWRLPILQGTCPCSCLMALVGTEPRRVRPRHGELQPANWRSMQDTSMFTQVPALATLCQMATCCRQCQDRRAMWTSVWRTGTSSSDMLMLPKPATSHIWCLAWDGWCTRDATWSEKSGNVPTGPWRHQARVARDGYIVYWTMFAVEFPAQKENIDNKKNLSRLSPEAKPTSPKWQAGLPSALTKRAGSSLFRWVPRWVLFKTRLVVNLAGNCWNGGWNSLPVDRNLYCQIMPNPKVGLEELCPHFEPIFQTGSVEMLYDFVELYVYIYIYTMYILWPYEIARYNHVDEKSPWLSHYCRSHPNPHLRHGPKKPGPTFYWILVG